MSTDAEPEKAVAKKTFMDLPREIYLMVCAYLTPHDLARLALVGKDCYLAVQQPLYDQVDITTWEQLPRLCRAFAAYPVVSQISAKQRQRWHKLSDAQLREREIKKLTILLDCKTMKRGFVAADFARLIGAISRRSTNVNIELSLFGPWHRLLQQLSTSTSTLPDVRRLVLCLGGAGPEFDAHLRASAVDIWDICFSGSIFPDLQQVKIDTLHASPSDRPENLTAIARGSSEDHISPFEGIVASSAPLYGLKKMSKIFIKHNDLLDIKVLGNLFSSSVIPARLTHLEIVNCSNLHQTRHYEDLAILLQRALPILQHFRFHLPRNTRGVHHFLAAYYKDTAEHPEWHLCNVVRELGQGIKSLDLALPFACNRMFLPRTKQAPAKLAERDWPPIAREPYETLPRRLLSAGYRYRRLICWDSICGGKHEWQDMLELADNQGDMISWEIVSGRDKTASWHVSGCLPMSYKANDVLKRELLLEER